MSVGDDRLPRSPRPVGAPSPGRAEAARPRPADGPREPIESAALFQGATEVRIFHRGAVYRLKQTSLGKLILTK